MLLQHSIDGKIDTALQRPLPFRSEAERLIDGLPVADSAKRGILAIYLLGEENGKTVADDGSTIVDAARQQVLIKMGCVCWRTYSRAIGSAQASGFVTVVPNPGQPHTFIIRWPAIVDASRPGAVAAVAKSKRRRSPRQGADIHESEALTSCAEGADFSRGGALTSAPKTREENRGADCAPHGHVKYGNKSHGEFELFGHGHGVPPWPKRIESRHLKDPAAVDELYRIALAWKNVDTSEATRIAFFATAHRVLRAKVPGAAFTSNVKKAKHEAFAQLTHADEEWARSAIKELRHSHPLVPAASEIVQQTATAFRMPSDQRTERNRQLAAVNAMIAEKEASP